MRTYKAKSGPFAEAIYYESGEIEQICADALREVGLWPDKPSPIRIERFIEKRFSVVPQYEDLPEAVLGYTRFGSRGVEEVIVSRSLSEENTQAAERRLTTTLAHEAGHGLLHGHLFALQKPAASLFSEEVDLRKQKILCRGSGITSLAPSETRGYGGRWWEVHANRAIGALLLPKPLVTECIKSLLAVRGAFGMRVLESARREEAIRRVSQTFEVNPVVARIRLEELFPVAQDAQLTL